MHTRPNPSDPKSQQIKEHAEQAQAELKASAHEVADEAKAAGRSVVDSIKTQGSETIAAFKSEIRTAAHQQQAQFAAGLNGIGKALNDAASTLESEQDSPALASATRSVAHYIDTVSHRVQDSSPKQLLHTVRDTARSHPALFIGGAALVGFTLGRFLRASERNDPPRSSQARMPIPQQSHVHDYQMDTRRQTEGAFERVNRGAPQSPRRYETDWADPRTHDDLAHDLIARRER